MFYCKLIALFIVCIIFFSGCGSKTSEMFKDRKNSVETTFEQQQLKEDMEKFKRSGVMNLSDDNPVTNMNEANSVSFEFEHLQ